MESVGSFGSNDWMMWFCQVDPQRLAEIVTFEV